MTKEIGYVFFQETQGKRIRSNNQALARKKRINNDTFINKKELKKKVEVKEMDMNKPITYQDFKLLNDDFKKMYINNLREKYRAKTGDIAKMMGTDTQVLSKYLSLHGLIKKGLPPMDKLDRENWNKFCGKSTVGEEPYSVPSPAVEPIIEPEAIYTVNTNKNKIIVTEATIKVTKLNMAELIDMFNNMMREGVNYTIHISEN